MAAKISGDKRKIAILVSQDEQGKRATALEGFDEKGNPKTKNINEQADFSTFLNINANDSALEAFFKKLSEQAQNPSHTGLYLVTLDQLDRLIQIKNPEEFNKALEPHKVDPKEVLDELRMQHKEQEQHRQGKDENPKEEHQNEHQHEPNHVQEQDQNPEQNAAQTPEQNLVQTPETPPEKQKNFKFDISKIDPRRREELGISDENFEKCSRSIAYGYKSPIVELSPLHDGERFPTKGRIYLTQQPDGTIGIGVTYHKEKLNLEERFMGVSLSDDVKKSLLAEGHGGRVVNLEPQPGKIVPSFISIDQGLNRLEYLPVEGMKISQTIKGKELTEDQHSALLRGEKVWVEGMTSRFGKPMDRYLQIDAANSNIKFIPKSGERQSQGQSTGQGREQSREQAQDRKLIVHDKFLGVPLEKWQKEAIQANKWTYLKGMEKEGSTELRNGWVRPNHEAGRFDIYTYIPREAMGKSIDLEYIKGVNGEKNQLIIKGSENAPTVTDATKQGQSQSAPKPDQRPDQRPENQPNNQPKRQQITPPKKKQGKGQGI